MAEQSKEKEYLWIALGDIHDDISDLVKIPELSQADAIIVTGDMTNCGGIDEARRVLEPIQKHSSKFFAQIGNMDKLEVTEWLQEKQCNLHVQVHEIAPNVAIFGVGASTITPFSTPSEFPESSYEQWLAECWEKAQAWKHKLLISHNPPKNTLCDVIGDNIHVGSTAVREFIEQKQPDLCVCGHIHEARNEDSIGRTVIINPGDFGAGGYVVLRYNGDKLSAQLKLLEK